jgi:uncharacterized membrane protein
VIQSLEKKQKNIVLVFIVFIVIFILSHDLWAWGQPTSVESLVLGLPVWLYYLLFLTLATFVFFFLVAKYVWRDEN